MKKVIFGIMLLSIPVFGASVKTSQPLPAEKVIPKPTPKVVLVPTMVAGTETQATTDAGELIFDRQFVVTITDVNGNPADILQRSERVTLSVLQVQHDQAKSSADKLADQLSQANAFVAANQGLIDQVKAFSISGDSKALVPVAIQVK